MPSPTASIPIPLLALLTPFDDPAIAQATANTQPPAVPDDNVPPQLPAIQEQPNVTDPPFPDDEPPLDGMDKQNVQGEDEGDDPPNNDAPLPMLDEPPLVLHCSTRV